MGLGVKILTTVELAGDLTDEPLEGQLAEKEVGGLLELPDLTKGDGPRSKHER